MTTDRPLERTETGLRIHFDRIEVSHADGRFRVTFLWDNKLTHTLHVQGAPGQTLTLGGITGHMDGYLQR